MIPEKSIAFFSPFSDRSGILGDRQRRQLRRRCLQNKRRPHHGLHLRGLFRQRRALQEKTLRIRVARRGFAAQISLRRMRQKLRDKQQSFAAQADAQNAGLWEREEVRRVREDVREYARALDARAHAQFEPQMWPVRESVFPAVAPARPSQISHGGQALR